MIYEKYGSPKGLKMKDVDKPSPQNGEILVKIKASSVNALDWHFLRGKPLFMRLMFGLLIPKNKILGYDFSGIVEEVGFNVTKFKVGDEVFGGLGFKLGGFAEYAVIGEDELVIHKSTKNSFEEAGAIAAAGLTAFLCIRDRAKVKKDNKVLINGAAGGVGTFSVQFAKYYGAEVTAVCSNHNRVMVKSLGADYVIDYNEDDFAKRLKRYDIIIDNVGNRRVKDLIKPLKDGGIYVGVGFTSLSLMMMHSIWGPVVAKINGLKWSMPQSKHPSQKDLYDIKKIIENNNIQTVIEKTYKLDQLSEAITYVETGHARSKVIIKIDD